MFGDSTGRANRRRAQQYGWAIGDGQWRYLNLDRQGEFLFDLAADPFETDNLIESGMSGAAQAAYDRLKSEGETLRAGE